MQRVWAQARLKPNRLDRYMTSNDPLFEQKAADIIGLYIIRRSPRQCSLWMRRPPFELWTGSIRRCRYRRDAPSGRALSTTATALSGCMLLWR